MCKSFRDISVLSFLSVHTYLSLSENPKQSRFASHLVLEVTRMPHSVAFLRDHSNVPPFYAKYPLDDDDDAEVELSSVLLVSSAHPH